MCGIFGVVGNDKNAPSVVLEGLKCLEYRGYDSWGVGVAIDGKIVIDKHVGKIGNSILHSSLFTPNSSLAFGHTRWATHGGVTDINAHPHLDCTGKISVVHNGIIENYQELKKELVDHKSISDTDTEVFAHLVEEKRKTHSLKDSTRLSFLQLKGLSAFLVAEADSQTLIAVKNGSPLVIGLGNGKNLIASDVNSLLPITKKVIFLEDNQLAEIKKDEVTIFDTETGEKVDPKIEHITYDAIQAEKQNYPHFMLKEINEEPKVIENILLNLKEPIKKFAENLRSHQDIYLTACGSAYFASLICFYMFAKVSKKNVTPIAGSEFFYKENFLDENSLVVFLSQSGETIDIIEPLKEIQKKGIKTAALVNVFGSTLYRLVDEKIWLEAGPEICVVSTKALIAKVSVLGLTAYALAGELDEGILLLQQAKNDVKSILSEKFQSNSLEDLAEILYKKQHVYVIGRGQSYPVASETALKLKEATYIHAEAFSGGELKHGAIVLIEKGTPVLVFAPNDETYSATISNAMEIKARGGFIIGISEKNNEVFDIHLQVKDSGIFTSLPQLTLGQLLAYKIAIKKGLDPDKPRNLAKSVTVK